jgi:AraC-like DNA-binding protein
MNSLLLIGTVFNLIVFLISIVYTKRWQAAPFYFNLCLGMCFWASLCAYLNISQLMAQVPHIFRTGFPAFYIFLGSGVLFIKKSFTGNLLLWSDLIFFIPTLIFLIDHAPFYIESSAYKKAVFEYDSSHQLINAFRQGWFIPANFHYRSRFFVGTATALYQFCIIYTLWKKHDKAFLYDNNSLLKWAFIYSCLLLITFSSQVTFVFGDSIPSITRLADAIPTFFLLFTFPVSLLFNPEILYGSKGFWSEEPSKKATEVIKAMPKIYFSADKAEEMREKLQLYMDRGKPYLNPEYNLNQLATDTGLPVRHVSALLNNFLYMSTSDYINQYRVRYFIERYQKDPNAKKITFEALANECGFNTRYTFINAFKKQTGRTPSQYFGANQS